MNKKALIYIRVSSLQQADKDSEGLSIPAQREACRRQLAQLDGEVVREYVEDGEAI